MPKAIIMAGGLGERFWPLTTEQFPKYCIPFGKKHSLLQRTYLRLLLIYKPDDIYVITTRAQKSIVRRQLPGLGASKLLLEPFRNNTAPAIGFTCRALKKKYGAQEVVSFFPADHLIQNGALFCKTMKRAIQGARDTARLMVLGIRPTFPATGFGYIQSGRPLAGYPDVFQVDRFVEKPNRSRARNYLKRGNFFWNSGIFTTPIGVLLSEMERWAPDQGYDAPGLSIDFAVLEKSDRVAFCQTRMDWCDMGNWDMWYERSPKDIFKNHAEGPVHLEGARRSLVINRALDKPLLMQSISDLIVVQTPRGTLICRRGHSEEAARSGSKKR